MLLVDVDVDVSASLRGYCYEEKAVYKWVKLFLREEKVSLMKRDQDDQQQAELKKTFTKVRQIVHENCRLTVRSIAEQVNIDRES